MYHIHHPRFGNAGRYTLHDEQMTPIYGIELPTGLCGPTPGSDVHMLLVNADMATPSGGQLSKLADRGLMATVGVGEERAHYQLTFPAAAAARTRALFLAAALAVNYVEFTKADKRRGRD